MDGERLGRIALRDNPLGQGLILTTLALLCLGVVMVYSTVGLAEEDAAWYYRRDARQVLFAAAGLLILLTLWRMDYRWLARRPWSGRRRLGWVPSPAVLLLLVGLGSAASVLVFGRHVRGTLRFLRFGPVGFQPSEVLKFGVLVFLVAYLSRPGARPRSLRRTLLPAAALVGLAAALVVTEDFGTAAIIGIGSGAVLLMGGVPLLWLLALLPFVGGGFYAFVVRQPWRWARVKAMLDPFNLSNPCSYQARQSLIAVAAGATPAGPGGGVAKYGYLPEHSTDFIFAMISEELGVLGAAAVIGLLLVWLVLALKIARQAPDGFGGLLVGGLAFLICLQAAMHIAVNVVWMPPTGVSLPFVSAGGTSLLAMSSATAVIVSVSSRRATADAG